MYNMTIEAHARFAMDTPGTAPSGKRGVRNRSRTRNSMRQVGWAGILTLLAAHVGACAMYLQWNVGTPRSLAQRASLGNALCPLGCLSVLRWDLVSHPQAARANDLEAKNSGVAADRCINTASSVRTLPSASRHLTRLQYFSTARFHSMWYYSCYFCFHRSNDVEDNGHAKERVLAFMCMAQGFLRHLLAAEATKPTKQGSSSVRCGVPAQRSSFCVGLFAHFAIVWVEAGKPQVL